MRAHARFLAVLSRSVERPRDVRDIAHAANYAPSVLGRSLAHGLAATPVLAALAALATPTAHAATVTGTVSAGRLPPAVLASLTQDRHVCGQHGLVFSSTVSADPHGRVVDAIVYLEARAPSDARALAAASPKRVPLLIDQRDCTFVPRVAAMAVGTELRVKSSDAVYHNVHVRRADGTTAANVSTPLAGTEVSALIASAPGPLVLGCDAGHHWMRADILVLEHGLFDRTRAGGRFRLDGVPAGAWWLVVWHPQLGERRVQLDVAAADRQVTRAMAY